MLPIKVLILTFVNVPVWNKFIVNTLTGHMAVLYEPWGEALDETTLMVSMRFDV